MTSLSASYTSELSLNGLWETGIDRDYSTRVSVPGLAGDPAQVTPGTVWYRRTVVLPEGEWTRATLTLYGARFCPRIYVNGDLVSSSEGGMTWTHHRFAHPAVQPGETVTLEIALADLDATDPGDASRIPAADRWRSNISSSLWDAVTLRCHGDNCLTRVIPSYDLASDTLTVHWETTGDDDNYIATVEILAIDGSILAANSAPSNADQTKIPLHGACELWSPETPHLYRLRVTLMAGARVLDMDEFSWAPRDFRIDGKKFRLNGLPVTFRAGSFVWHRFVRDREGREIAWDTAWIEENIVRRLKAHGANGLRFHLGMPPEALLDLCDKYGLLVQAEWSFFHGMPGAKVSLLRQWRNWFDLIMRHPSIVIIHPWNETEGEELDTAFAALTEIVSDYPPLVIAHRDTLHI
ncbi:MAG TPA: glycoside hydrolase, partial [Armatimonadota bacterium]|nr:glycoside hydrolase [Armatimonadota bacterium]